MAARISDIDVILEDNDQNPICQHGPALLFVKYNENGEGREFYACSAFRDRKECNLFQWKDEKVTDEKKANRETIQREIELTFNRMKKRCHKLRKLTAVARVCCKTCGQLLLPEERGKHAGHDILSPVDDETLQKPSKLFTPLDNNKTFAQYLFSESAIKFTIDLLKKRGITHILCVGAPRIHEAVHSSRDCKVKSLLLDLDDRYQQVYPPEQFCRFNMFNHYFFNDTKAEKVFSEFITETDNKCVAMVTDPPFGGRVEVLTSTITKIMDIWKTKSPNTDDRQLPVLWFFPYFMERRITECLPQFSMLDYKVDYDNHALFRGDVKKYGSPVRIFTNISPSQIVLPATEGYWYCKECDRYSAKENVHCQMCEACTSKDGRTYRHCFKCERCVKPSKVHCDKCDVCQLKDHRCGQVLNKGCHICGELNHKRKSCPNKANKRKRQDEDQAPVKKKKSK